MPHPIMTPMQRTALTQERIVKIAAGIALLAHLILAFLLPNLPPIQIPNIDRGNAISVFLRSSPSPEPLNQNLENPGLAQNQVSDYQPTTSLSVETLGEDDSDTEEAPLVETEKSDDRLSKPKGEESHAGLSPRIIISRSSIQLFAQQDAFEFAENNPEALQRFERSFRSRPNIKRRSRSENYVDRYGDYYVRNASTRGDICFKQEKIDQDDELATNLVMFFRCDREPLKLALNSRKNKTKQ